MTVAGCATLGTTDQTLVPTKFQTQVGPYTVFTNYPIAPDAPPIRQLQSLERQLEAKLAIRVDPAEGPIEVYILNDRKAFEHFLRFYYPELPPRRAFFLAQGSRRVVYTSNGDRLEEDLRHEATHALLHAAVAELPLWLDEGLAEYFEVREERDGVNDEHMSRLPLDLAEDWTPSLEKLEEFQDVRKMSPRDYRESWAWVHFCLNGPNSARAALLAYLGDLRTSPSATPLSRRLDSAGSPPGRGLIAHIQQVREDAIATANPPHEEIVRLQDSPDPLTPRRRGILTRLRELFGF
jgi:hypothetical protein